MIEFFVFIFVAIGLLLLIGGVAFYGIAVLVAPFVNLYTAIKEGNKKNIILFLIAIGLFVLSFLIVSIIPK